MKMSNLSENLQEVIVPKINENFQVLAALNSTGAGFEARGGSSLMLMEPIENSVDSIIEAIRQHTMNKGIIRIFLDNTNEQVVIVDNGLGFVDPRHICEKPFDSLKKYDPELTGKFARGLQGFRSYCNELTFVTKRLAVPSGEVIGGKSGKTVKLEFEAAKIEVKASVGNDEEFAKWSCGDFDHGAIAFYRLWKKGEFSKIRKDKLIRRIERHFGELIRKGEIEISLWEGTDLKPGVRQDPTNFYECKPRDYSKFVKIDLPSIPFLENGNKKGDVVFELFLTTGPRSDRDVRPYLMFKDRPVGDGPISEIEEFAETDVWNSYYLTGFIRADFCQINELRLALKPGPERDFLYQQIDTVESKLREEIKKHHSGLIDIKRSQEINALVNKLQAFLKTKNIFDFKFAKELGQIATKEKQDLKIPLTSPGTNETSVASSASGEPIMDTVPIKVTTQTNVVPGKDENIHTHQDLVGGKGGKSAESTGGGPDGLGDVQQGGGKGYSTSKQELDKTKTIEEPATTGNGSNPLKNVRKRKPRGFNIDTQEDEYSDQLSFFDPVTSTIVVNSGNERYKKREDPNVPVSKDLLDYMSELYIFEICKLAKTKNADLDLPDLFLKTKYEFFEAS
jgi:hypothetical protein